MSTMSASVIGSGRGCVFLKKGCPTDCFAHSLYWHRMRDVLRFFQTAKCPWPPRARMQDGRTDVEAGSLAKKLLFGRRISWEPKR